MKTRHLFLFICVTALSLVYSVLSSCKSDVTYPVDYGQVVFKGDGSSIQMVPVSNSPGAASFSGIYDASQRVFNFTLKWNGLDSTVTTARFYGPNTAGQTNVALRDIFTGASRPKTDSIQTFISGSNRLSDSEVADLKNGKWYYIITTQGSPNGLLGGKLFTAGLFTGNSLQRKFARVLNFEFN